MKKIGKFIGKAGNTVVNTAKNAVGNTYDAALSTIKEIPKSPGRLIDEAQALTQDPAGYIQNKVTNTSFRDVTSAVTLGLDRVAEQTVRDAGLGKLVDGLDAFADVVSDVTAIVLQAVTCSVWIKNPGFHAATAVIYAARVAGIIKSKNDAYSFVKGGEFLKAVSTINVPLLDLLPCAIEAAFLVPLPATGRGRGSLDHLGTRAAKELSESALGLAAGIVGDKSVATLRIAARSPAVGAISRSQDKLDILVVRGDGSAITAAWQPGDSSWRGWWLVANGRATPGTPVTAVSRSKDKLDVFMVGLDGRVWTAAWESGDTSWRGWWPIGNLKTLPGTPVGAVSRSTDKLDVFVTGTDGRVYTAAWQAGDASWQGWWPVANGRTTPGTPITAVSRSKDKLDIFMVGLDGRVWTAAWEPRPGDTAWRGWWPIGNVKTLPGAPVGVVSRSTDKLDVFITGTDGVVHTAAWEPRPGDTSWRGWWPVANGRATPGTPVTAVSRSRDKLDIFMVGLDGRVWTAAWQPGDTSWRGWWAIGQLEVVPMTAISCVSRSADKLDIFVRGIDHEVFTAAWQPGDRNWRGWWQLT
jgi:hypothetical protein